MESRGREGGVETPLPTSGPRGAQSHLTKRENIPRATSARTCLKKKPALPLTRAERKPFDRKKNIPRATGARTSLKKKPALPLARAERKPLDQKKKPAPRYQRENQLKEKTSSAAGPRGAQSHLTERIKSALRRRAQPPHHFTSSPKI